MFKKILSLIFLILFSLNFNTTYAANPTSEEITNFNVEYRIREDGTVYVIETIEYYFPEPKHGIYREIPLKKINEDGEAFLMEVSNVYVYKDERGHVNFKDFSRADRIKLKIGHDTWLEKGKTTYTIHYVLSGALTYFSDHDEFYWNVTGNGWEVPIRSSKATVKLPGEIRSNIKSNCFTGSHGSTESDCYSSSLGNVVSYSSKETLYPGEGLTITAFFPKGFVTQLEPIEDSLLNRYSIEAIIFVSIFYILVPFFLIFRAIKRIRKTEYEKRVVAAWFDPPKDINGQPMSASEVGILHDKKGDIRDFTAGIVQLAQRGYLKIEEIPAEGLFKKVDYKLTKLKAEDHLLKMHERKILEILFTKKTFKLPNIFDLVTKRGNEDLNNIERSNYVEIEPDSEVLISEISKSTSIAGDIRQFYVDISRDLVNDGFFIDDPLKTRSGWSYGVFPALIIYNPILAIAFFLMSRSARRTEQGGLAYSVIESMNNFVKSQDKQLEFQAKNQMMFEKLLPYAIALGVEKIWVERFDDLELTNSEWYVSSTGYNNLALANFASSFSTTVSKNVSISSKRSSSGFSSGGGGFSGGGGGGGGGGSW